MTLSFQQSVSPFFSQPDISTANSLHRVFRFQCNQLGLRRVFAAFFHQAACAHEALELFINPQPQDFLTAQGHVLLLHHDNGTLEDVIEFQHARLMKNDNKLISHQIR